MGFISDLLTAIGILPLLHALHPRSSPGLLAIGFAIVLVLWLVAVEEWELRRSRAVTD